MPSPYIPPNFSYLEWLTPSDALESLQMLCHTEHGFIIDEQVHARTTLMVMMQEPVCGPFATCIQRNVRMWLAKRRARELRAERQLQLDLLGFKQPSEVLDSLVYNMAEPVQELRSPGSLRNKQVQEKAAEEELAKESAKDLALQKKRNQLREEARKQLEDMEAEFQKQLQESKDKIRNVKTNLMVSSVMNPVSGVAKPPVLQRRRSEQPADIANKDTMVKTREQERYDQRAQLQKKIAQEAALPSVHRQNLEGEVIEKVELLSPVGGNRGKTMLGLTLNTAVHGATSSVVTPVTRPGMLLSTEADVSEDENMTPFERSHCPPCPLPLQTWLRLPSFLHLHVAFRNKAKTQRLLLQLQKAKVQDYRLKKQVSGHCLQHCL